MDDIPYSGRSSPGDGVTLPKISREPLATEGEATPGPDDVNPFEEQEAVREQMEFDEPDETPEFALMDEPDDTNVPEFDPSDDGWQRAGAFIEFDGPDLDLPEPW